MKNWKKVSPYYPSGKEGSFVAAKREHNPIKIDFYILPEEKNTLYARIYFKVTSEGPPKHVHGGCQAAVLDELMGSCGWQNNFSVVAAKIEVEFLAMLPSEASVFAKAKIYKTEDRKVYIEASIYLEDTVYSKSKGIFMILSDKKLENLKKLISN